MLMKELQARSLPALRSRAEMVEIMQREVFGYLPEVEHEISVAPFKKIDERFGVGEVMLGRAEFTVKTARGSHTFPLYRLAHRDGKRRPLIIYDDIYPEMPSRYFPVEELAEYDVDYLIFCYKEVSTDDGDFSTGLAPLLLPNGQDTSTACGKIGIWAWATMRVMDYALTLPTTDADNVMVAGHSRLGKTALVTGMLDERFRFVYSNMSGCTGAALSRGNTGLLAGAGAPRAGRGENMADILEKFPYWFCKNYQKYLDKLYADEFDQHFLLATICPRCVLVGSADLDLWADPYSEQLGALAAGRAWEERGLSGLVGSDHRLSAGEALLDGRVGYFLIHSKHYMSRYGWAKAVSFIETHKIQ